MPSETSSSKHQSEPFHLNKQKHFKNNLFWIGQKTTNCFPKLIMIKQKPWINVQGAPSPLFCTRFFVNLLWFSSIYKKLICIIFEPVLFLVTPAMKIMNAIWSKHKTGVELYICRSTSVELSWYWFLILFSAPVQPGMDMAIITCAHTSTRTSQN